MYRGVEQSGQLGWLITNRSQVRILPPQPRKDAVLVTAFFLGLGPIGSATFCVAKIVAGSA